MKALTLTFVILAAALPAQAAGKAKGGKRSQAARPVAAETRAEPRAEVRGETRGDEPAAEGESKATTTKTPKAKVHTFSGLDVEGKLKTPQLLYFLNRVKLELDTTSPEKRSFLKELEKTSDDKGL
jgi:hypothetical protein